MSSYLIVCVGEELDHQGKEVEGDNIMQGLRELLAVHGNVRDLLHKLCTHTGLCKIITFRKYEKLHFVVKCCVALCCVVFVVSYFAVLNYVVLYFVVFYFAVLYYAVFNYVVLYFVVLYFAVLYYAVLYYALLYYVVLYHVFWTMFCCIRLC